MQSDSTLYSFRFDSSMMKAQTEEFIALLRLHVPDHASDELICKLPKLLFDIVLSNGTTAVIADGIKEFTVGLQFGGVNYEKFMIALRAVELRTIHEMLDLVSLSF